MLKKYLIVFLIICVTLSGCMASEGGATAALSIPFLEPEKEDLPPLPETPIRESLDVNNRIPSADGVAVFSNAYVNIDYSNSSKGYIMVEYVGSHTGKIKFRVVDSLGETYTYDLHGKTGFQTFPLTGGSGTYTLQTFEQSSGTEYYSVDSQTLLATIEDEFSPFLYSNQYVDFSTTTDAVLEAQLLYSYTSNDMEFIERVFEYTQQSITYDYDKAEQAANGEISGYLPILDETISTGYGICFDYAAVMTAMLRSQNVPTKLVIGYAGEVYHAWIDVYTKETGWIGAIEFNGTEWSLMDPTFTDNGSDTTFIGSGDNYAEKYTY